MTEVDCRSTGLLPPPAESSCCTPPLPQQHYGVTHLLPAGDVVSCSDNDLVDDSHGMTVHDVSGRLQWSFKFFENLHMDVTPARADHLRRAMERKARALFEEHYQIREGRRISNSSRGSPTHQQQQQLHYSRRRTPTFRPQDDPTWSPIIDVDYMSVPVGGDNSGGAAGTPSAAAAAPPANGRTRRRPSRSGGVSPSSTTTSVPALSVIHRLAHSPDEEIVMARFLLPLRRGLYEVIIVAGDDSGNAQGVAGGGGGSGSNSSGLSLPSLSLPTAAASASAAPNEGGGEVRTPAMDGPEHDERFPHHCLSRVRRAVRWLTTEAMLRVTDAPPPAAGAAGGGGVDLPHLHCKIVPPARFLYCPNPHTHPESNKYRFCRATLGGTDGVEMMVVSCWYGKDIGRGVKALRRLAVHAARVIHESQQMVHIRVEAQEVNLGAALASRRSGTSDGHPGTANGATTTSRGRWLLPAGVVGGGGSSSNSSSHDHKDAVITSVDCSDAQGTRKQNTIGWIREPTTGTVYLVYFADTLYMDEDDVHGEIATTLASLRVPRLLLTSSVRRKLAWHAASPAPVASS